MAMPSTAEPSYYNDYETLSYKVLESFEPDIEIRHYAPAIAVTTQGTTEDNAFSLLFKYISGDNLVNEHIAQTQPLELQSAKVAMTTPVEMQPAGNGEKMRFFLPSQYDVSNAPRPIHPEVSLEEIPAKTVAVIRYSGYNSDNKIEKHEKILRDVIAQKGYDIAGEKTVFGYDAPWRLWWLRRNEVVIPIAMGATP